MKPRRVTLTLECETDATIELLEATRSIVVTTDDGRRRTVRVVQAQANNVERRPRATKC